MALCLEGDGFVADSDIPREVRDLIVRQLHSMEEIEALLLLAAEPTGLTISEIRDRLRLPQSELAPPSLALLTAHRLIRCDDASGLSRYSYAVTDPAVRRTVDLLRVAYNERPVTLVRLVYNRPSTAQSFADAFRIKKDDQS
jgi:hypothetical protein